MDKNSIILSDWKRILLGTTSVDFLFETLLRTLVIYLLLLVAIRFLGKRMSGQVSVTEVAVMLTLGAIVAVPMQVAGRGLIPAVLILGCVVILQRGLNRMAFHSSRIDKLIHGSETVLIKDSRLHLEGLKQAVISKEQVFAQLRSQDIRHLGQVKRAYLEVKGGISVFMEPKPQFGLPVLPLDDSKLLEAQPHQDDIYACGACGEVRNKKEIMELACPRCQARKWVRAISSNK